MLNWLIERFQKLLDDYKSSSFPGKIVIVLQFTVITYVFGICSAVKHPIEFLKCAFRIK